MGFGGQSRGLIQAAKTAGWDPTVIPARGDKPAQGIADFDVDPGIANGQKYTGQLPEGTPLAYPTDPAMTQRDTWSTHYQSEPKVRRGTKNANPTPGMPGA